MAVLNSPQFYIGTLRPGAAVSAGKEIKASKPPAWSGARFSGSFGGESFCDDESSAGRNGHCIDCVESFVQSGNLQLQKRSGDGCRRNSLFSGALIVALHCLAQGSPEEIRHRAKAGSARRANISRPVARHWICVVDCKRLFRREASGEQDLLAVTGPQHVQTDADMCVEEMLAIKRGLARPLGSDEDHGFHASLRAIRGASRVRAT